MIRSSFVPVTEAFPFRTYHVQGIAFAADRLFLSTTDARGKRGLLLKIDISAAKPRLAGHAVLSIGRQIHPGGITESGGVLLVPLAESRNRGQTSILAVSPTNLSCRELFSASTHIGAVAREPESGRLFGADYDSRHLYQWSHDGGRLLTQENPTPIAYQDMEYHDGRVYCSGVDTRNRAKGRVDVYELGRPGQQLRLERTLELPEIGRGINLGREAMTIRAGSLYFLPEDEPSSRLYRLATGALSE